MLFSGGLDSAVLLARRRTRRGQRVDQPIYVSAGLAWEREERAMATRFLAARVLDARGLPLVAAHRRHARRLSGQRTGPFAASRPRYDTPDEDVYLEGRNIVLLSKAVGVHGARRHPTVLHRPARRQSVSRRDARRSSTRWRARLSLGLGAPIAIEAPFRRDEEGRRHPARDVARRSVRADAVVHAAARRSALRSMQQVPGAHRGVQRSGWEDPADYAQRTVLIVDGRLLITGSLHVRASISSRQSAFNKCS